MSCCAGSEHAVRPQNGGMLGTVDRETKARGCAWWCGLLQKVPNEMIVTKEKGMVSSSWIEPSRYLTVIVMLTV